MNQILYKTGNDIVGVWREMKDTEAHVIEFRNGRFFQNLEADNSGPLATAQVFPSMKAADSFMRQNDWIYMNGGMAMTLRKARENDAR